MQRRSFLLHSIKGGSDTKVSVLGQNTEMMEYNVDISPKPVWQVTEEGLFVSAIKAQRLNKTWDNPLVLKLENVEYQAAP